MRMACFGKEHKKALCITVCVCLALALVISLLLLYIPLIGKEQPWSNYRLSNHTLPHHYNITLTPHNNFKTFEGQVSIDVHILKPTSVIYLHARLHITLYNPWHTSLQLR